ncbi:hypothetical protein JD844_014708 [Phrynosoma platyrhinos]|uniref:snRNA-activating protein complex subunit 5 n=1 Tax=Phrynosoma platyrhinos TaxID=52577 RepID=A0ABQ7SS39_PHRPL|nr:hypothetical protein JD844_014708 [Phrynosoma platyrhinos]
MLSRLQELRKEEETLLRVKAALHDQLNRLKVRRLINQAPAPLPHGTRMDNEAAINQTKLQLQMCVSEEEEEEEEEESDS